MFHFNRSEIENHAHFATSPTRQLANSPFHFIISSSFQFISLSQNVEILQDVFISLYLSLDKWVDLLFISIGLNTDDFIISFEFIYLISRSTSFKDLISYLHPAVSNSRIYEWGVLNCIQQFIVLSYITRVKELEPRVNSQSGFSQKVMFTGIISARVKSRDNHFLLTVNTVSGFGPPR